MIVNTVKEIDNLIFAEQPAGQFAIGIMVLNNPRALNALTHVAIGMAALFIRAEKKTALLADYPSSNGLRMARITGEPWTTISANLPTLPTHTIRL